ncbi:MAG: hypothetical protein HIU91_11470 [Acidobacteria bacterium]|nr:hypothetical protein [Acidobacteriota bacterium]
MRLQRLLCVAVGCGLIGSTMSVAQEKGNWRAANSAAKSITGDIAFSSEKLAINFASFWFAEIRTLTPAEVGSVFDAGNGSAGSGELYRVSIPGDKRFLHKNTLCGGEDVQWIAAYVSGHELQLALFSGGKPPVFTPEGMANAADLCGTFAYVK